MTLLSNIKFLSVGMAALLLTACLDSDGDEIVPENRPPTGADSTFTISAGTTLQEDLLVHDPDGDALTFSLEMQASNGTATINSDGSFSYQPDSEFVGTDSFTYRVSDGTASDTGTVTIMVETAQVSLRDYTRSVFAQQASDEPLPVIGREFTQDVNDTAEFDDLVAAGSIDGGN